MECNKDEAKRAMDIAEKKLSENDYVGAKKFVSKAQNLYPQLDGLEQVSMMIHVYTSAANKINGGRATDWYGVLGVDPLADDEALKKQYKKLALLLHPDKNKCKGAEGAFKLVLNAWYLLSDKVKRTAYDQKRKSSTGVQKPPPNQHKPDSSNGKQNARDGVDPNARARSNHPASGPQKPPNPHKPAFSSVNQNARDGVHPRANTRNNKPAPAPAPVPAPAPAPVPAPAPAPAPGPEPVNPSKQRKDGIFWTMCNGCKTRSQFRRDRYLNKTIACLNCGQDYTATEKNPWDVHVRFFNDSLSRIRQRQQQWSAQNQATNKNTNGASSSGTSSSPFVGATEKNHLWESYVTQVNSALSLVRQQQQQWNSQNQAANNNTNEASTSGTSSSPYVGATPQERFALQQLYSALYLLKLKQQWSAQKQAANNNWRSTSPSVSATGKAPHASVVRPGNLSSSSPQQQQQQQRSAKSQATNTFTNGASSLRTNSSPFVSATQETPQASAKSQETNKNTTGASSSGRVSSPYVSATAKTPPGSFMWPGANLSSSPQQQLLQQQRQQLLQQQRQLQQQCGAQNTSGGTYYPSSSSARGSSPSVNATGKTPPGRFVWPGVNFSSSPQQKWGAQNTSGGTCYPSSSGSSHQDCSVSVTASSNSGNAANQAQETSKRGLEDSQETLAAAERLFKKPRTDVT